MSPSSKGIVNQLFTNSRRVKMYGSVYVTLEAVENNLDTPV